MRRMRDEETMCGLREGMDPARLLTKMPKGCKIIEDQTTQEDWHRIDTWRYCSEYKELEKLVGYEKYCREKEVKLKDKEQWTRMRCGNIGQAGNKGYMKVDCRLGGAGKENLKHISDCLELQKMVKTHLRLAVKEVMKVEGNEWPNVLDNNLELPDYAGVGRILWKIWKRCKSKRTSGSVGRWDDYSEKLVLCEKKSMYK